MTDVPPPRRQIWFVVVPLRFNRGGSGATANRDRFAVTPQKERPDMNLRAHHMILPFMRNCGLDLGDGGKKVNDWRTPPRAVVTFRLNCFSRFPSTNCRQFVSNLCVVCALCAQRLKSIGMDVSFRQMSSLEGPCFFCYCSHYITFMSLHF